MLTPNNVTAAQFNSAIKGGEPSHVRLTFTGQNITLMDDDISANGGIVIRNYLNAETDLTIGVAVKKELTAYIFNSNAISGLDWEGEFKFEVGTEVNGSIEWVTQGYFTGIRPAKIYNVDVIQFVAYDRMNKFDILADDWLGNLTYPMTIRQMYDSLCLYCGVQNEVGDELANIMSRSYASAPIKNTELSCRDILTLIAEAAGCYAKITAGGKVKLVWYNSTSYSITGDDEFSIENVDLQSINLMAIDGLNVKQTETDTGVLIQTGSRNTYLIVDNPFLVTSNSTEEDDYIQPIFDRLSGFGGYLPMNVVCIGNPLIEAGDIISVAIGNDTFSLPIFNKEESFNGALTDMYEATGNMQRQTYTQALKQKLSQGGRYHIFKNTVDQLYSELYDPTTGDVSILNQTAQALGLSANGIDIVGGKYVKILSGGIFQVTATDFSIDSVNKVISIGKSSINENGLVYYFTELLPSGDKSYMKILTEEVASGTTTHKIFTFQVAAIHETNNQITDQYNLRFEQDTHHLASGEDPDTRYGSFKIIPYIPGASGKKYFGSLGTSSFFFEKAYIYDIWIDHDVQCDGKGDFSGNLYCQDLYQRSSRNAKHDIKFLGDTGKIIDALDPVSFIYNDDKSDRKRFGLIYEDTIDILPEICNEEDGRKRISYVELVPVLLKEIQSLRKRVASLENPTN